MPMFENMKWNSTIKCWRKHNKLRKYFLPFFLCIFQWRRLFFLICYFHNENLPSVPVIHSIIFSFFKNSAILSHNNWNKIYESRSTMLQTSFKYNSLCSWTVSRGGERTAKEDRYHTGMSVTFNRQWWKVIFFFPSVSSRLVDRTHYCANEPARCFSHLPH